MTVSYTLHVATCTGLGCFWKLLFRWKGSTWKLLWLNVLVFVILVAAVTCMRKFLLNDAHLENFEKVAKRMRRDKDMIPMAFILGFYVNLVITRWWSQYVKMPWPDRMAVYISTLIYGQDDRGRLIRRTLIRYCNLALILTLRLFSTRIKRRFATYDNLVDAGLLQLSEKQVMEHMDLKSKHPKYWMPLVWAGSILVKARKEGRVRDDFSMKTLVDALNTFRGECGGMIDYDWICIPLVYTQVVTLAVYAFIVTSVIGSQATGDDSHTYYFPIFSFMKLFFYMGWLKVAETLVNPWGDDDDDFEVNWMVDRHLQVSYMIVDEMHQEHPEMLKDQYWDEVFPAELPYTQASKPFNFTPASNFNLNMDDLMGDKGEMDESSVTSDEFGGAELRENYSQAPSEARHGTADSSVPRSVSKAAKKWSFISKKNKKSKRSGKPKSGTLYTSGSRLLYEANTASLSSITALYPNDSNKPPTEDEMCRMSEDSIAVSQTKSRAEEMEEEEEAVEEELRLETNLLGQLSPTSMEYVTDLIPVDLSEPDSKTSLPIRSDQYKRVSIDSNFSGSRRNSSLGSDVHGRSFSRINVATPSTESGGSPFPPPVFTDTTSQGEASTNQNELTRQNADKRVVFTDSSPDGMVTILPPSGEIDSTQSPVYLRLTPTSSGSATQPTGTTSMRVIDIQGDETGPEVAINIDDLETESLPGPSNDRGWRGFHELEPIKEQSEPNAEDQSEPNAEEQSEPNAEDQSEPNAEGSDEKTDEPKKPPHSEEDGAGPSTSSN